MRWHHVAQLEKIYSIVKIIRSKDKEKLHEWLDQNTVNFEVKDETESTCNLTQHSVEENFEIDATLFKIIFTIV